MRRLRRFGSLAAPILLVSSVLVGGAGALPLPEFQTGDLFARYGPNAAVLDVQDITNPSVVEWWDDKFPTGRTAALVDSDGYLYLGVDDADVGGRGLMIYGPDFSAQITEGVFEPVGYAPNGLEPGEGGSPIGAIVTRQPGQVIGATTGNGKLYVFNIVDRQAPFLERVVELGEPSSRWHGRIAAFDANGDLWNSYAYDLRRLTLDAQGEVVSSVTVTSFSVEKVAFGPLAFEAGSNRLFSGMPYRDSILVMDVTNPPSTYAGATKIENVCGFLDSIVPAFNSSGDLFVSCSRGIDYHVFAKESLVGLSGSVEASSLNPVSLEGPMNLGGWLAFQPLLSPEAATEALIEEIGEMDLPTGLASSLNAKVGNAFDILSDGNDANDIAAIRSLEAFINQVEAQAGKKIPQEDADALIAAAQQIIGLLTG